MVGKNVSLALGLAVHFLGPVTAAMLAVNPLLQAPAMAWFYRWSARLREGREKEKGPATSPTS